MVGIYLSQRSDLGKPRLNTAVTIQDMVFQYRLAQEYLTVLELVELPRVRPLIWTKHLENRLPRSRSTTVTMQIASILSDLNSLRVCVRSQPKHSLSFLKPHLTPPTGPLRSAQPRQRPHTRIPNSSFQCTRPEANARIPRVRSRRPGYATRD